MNATLAQKNEPADTTSRAPKPTGYRDVVRYRERDYGTGYGRSSGYALERQYSSSQNKHLFRCG